VLAIAVDLGRCGLRHRPDIIRVHDIQGLAGLDYWV